MTIYEDCYDSTGNVCSGKAQPGTRALRDGCDDLFPELGDFGIYNCRPSSGGGGLSTHGEGRGWDAACNAMTPEGLALGNRLAALLIKYHEELGIQRIIWNRRQWDVNTKAWRAYHGQSAHLDHLHIELCWEAARDNPLTVEYVKLVLGQEDWLMALTEKEQEELLKKVRDVWKDHGDEKNGVYTGVLEDVEKLGVRLKGIEDALARIEAKP